LAKRCGRRLRPDVRTDAWAATVTVIVTKVFCHAVGALNTLVVIVALLVDRGDRISVAARCTLRLTTILISKPAGVGNRFAETVYAFEVMARFQRGGAYVPVRGGEDLNAITVADGVADPFVDRI
jgi:hypothetical protein